MFVEMLKLTFLPKNYGDSHYWRDFWSL